MNCSEKSIDIRKNALFNEIFQKVISMPPWQRTYDWLESTAHPMITEIISTANTPDNVRHKNITFIGNAIIFNDTNNNKYVVADGHSRIITYTLIFKALHDICAERGYNICVPEPCNVSYKLGVAVNAYARFLRNPSGNTTYAKVYTYAYKKLNVFISSEKRAFAMLDTLMHHVYMGFQECDTMALAQRAFVQHNCGGKNLTKVEAASSLIEFAKENHLVELEYEYNELATLVESYYYWKSCDNIAPSFSIEVMTGFIENFIVNTRENMMQFSEFLDNINCYKNTSWFNLAKILGPKTVALTYVLAGKGYDLSGDDDDVNELMRSLIVFDIACLARHANNGSIVSGYFCDIKKQIGCGLGLDIINSNFLTWAENHNVCYGDTFKEFSKNLDTLNNDYQKAILWFTYIQHNKNSIPVNITCEHSYAQQNDPFWTKAGWPTNPNEQRLMVNSLGNKILLDAKTNRDLSNSFIDEKKAQYEKFYNVNSAYSYTENYFDCDAFKDKKKDYLDERRDAYAKILADTAMGKFLIRA